MMPSFHAAVFSTLAISTSRLPLLVKAFVNPAGVGQTFVDQHRSSRPADGFGKSCLTEILPFSSIQRLSCFTSSPRIRTSGRHDSGADNSGVKGPFNMVTENNSQASGRDGEVNIPGAAVRVQAPHGNSPKTISASADKAPRMDTVDNRAGSTEDNTFASFLDELVQRCEEATRPGAAMESPHTGSSEWAGFRTTKPLLDAVTNVLGRTRQRSRRSDGSAMTWSWLTLSPRPVRVAVAVENRRFAIYLTVLPAGNGSPPSHRPMYGCHMLSRVLAGEVEQVKSNSQRVIGRSTHSVETPVWSSYGGGARRLVNESFLPAVVLEVVLYDWSRGSGYSGSYSAPGTSESQSAERRAEVEGSGTAPLGSAAPEGKGKHKSSRHGVDTLVSMDECPCDPEILFRDGDVYEDEEDQGGDEGVTGVGDLVLVRRDGKVAHGRGATDGQKDTHGGSGVLDELLTADDLACDVGGLDGQLEDITRRVLATRSLPAKMRQALGVSHVRGLLLYGPPGCGKTLLARELSRRLGARPPKLVSGPEILDKWVGEAERKVRLLFLDAELEHERCAQMGDDPAGLPLNLICFDEIDALCRSRGALSGDTSGVRDSVVNQILSKMDGLVNLQNVLVVGMTNRKELLDEALLRPGRMEVCMLIPLPDAKGRQQILGIHLRQAKDAGLVSSDVDEASIADKTEGFSGADLAGLVRSAISFAIADWRQINVAEEKPRASPGDDRDKGSVDGTAQYNVNGSPGLGVYSRGGGLSVTASNFDKALSEVQASVRGGLRSKLRRAVSKIVRGD